MTSSQNQGISLSSEVVALLRRHALLRPLIEREVMAEQLAGIALPQEQTQALFDQYRNQHRLNDASQLHQHLQERGLRLPDLEWQLELNSRRDLHALQTYRIKAEQRFLQRKNDLDRVVYSLLRVSDPYLAQELFLRISEGESTFTELAGAHSEGPERQTKGIVGPVPLTQAHPLLAERLRTRPPGEVQEPFSIENWWLVVRVEEFTPAVFDDAVALQMSLELFQMAISEETTRRLAALSVSGLEPGTAP